MTNRFLYTVLLINAFFFFIAGCSGRNIYSLNLLPTPAIYVDGLVNPFTENYPVDTSYEGILYATNRSPAEQGDDKNRFYTAEPGGCLRLGIGHIEVRGKPMKREETQRISILKKKENHLSSCGFRHRGNRRS